MELSFYFLTVRFGSAIFLNFKVSAVTRPRSFFTERLASRITFLRSQKSQILALFVISDSNHEKCDEICCLSLSIGPLTQQHHLKNVLFEKCLIS